MYRYIFCIGQHTSRALIIQLSKNHEKVIRLGAEVLEFERDRLHIIFRFCTVFLPACHNNLGFKSISVTVQMY